MTQQAHEEEKKRLYELIAQSYTSNRSKWEVELFEDYMLQEEIPKLVDDLVDGGVIVPPCKVGDTVYLIMAAYSTLDKSTYFAVPIEGVVDCISYCVERGNEIDIRLNSDFGGEIVFRKFEDYKKTFFLDRKEAVAALEIILKDITREAAEQALKERET